MKSLTLLLPLLLSTVPALSLADAGSSTKSIETDSAGTTTTTNTSNRNTDEGSGGQKIVEEETTVVDPKGMLNKTSATSHSERDSSANGDYSDTKTTKHADGTKDVNTKSRETTNHWLNKGKTTTTTVGRSVDPKGLGNKEKSEIEEKVETNSDGSEKTTVTKTENGERTSVTVAEKP